MTKVTKAALEAQIAKLTAQLDAKGTAVVSEVVKETKKGSDLKFKDLRAGNEYVLRIPVASQLKVTQMVKWSEKDPKNPQAKGIALGSWLKIDVQAMDDDAKTYISFLVSKNKAGFMYLGEVQAQAAKESAKETVVVA